MAEWRWLIFGKVDFLSEIGTMKLSMIVVDLAAGAHLTQARENSKAVIENQIPCSVSLSQSIPASFFNLNLLCSTGPSMSQFVAED